MPDKKPAPIPLVTPAKPEELTPEAVARYAALVKEAATLACPVCGNGVTGPTCEVDGWSPGNG